MDRKARIDVSRMRHEDRDRTRLSAIAAVRALGATTGCFIDYTSSGDRTGDDRDVVAYAGLIFD